MPKVFEEKIEGFLETMLNLRSTVAYLSLAKRQFTCNIWRHLSTLPGNEKIEVSNRIKRSPTDILKALSQTVGFDPTAPHYKYHDDPFLVPMSNVAKRAYALSQESGRKSAKWIRQENSELFQVRPS